jgi:hypothetical protein
MTITFITKVINMLTIITFNTTIIMVTVNYNLI